MEASGGILPRWSESPGRRGRIRPALYKSNTDHEGQRNAGRQDRPPLGSASPGRRHPRSKHFRGKGALPLPSAGTARLGKPSLLTPRICVRLGHCVLLKYICVPLGSAESPLKRFTQRDGTAAALSCNLMHWGEKIEGAYYCA